MSVSICVSELAEVGNLVIENAPKAHDSNFATTLTWTKHTQLIINVRTSMCCLLTLRNIWQVDWAVGGIIVAPANDGKVEKKKHNEKTG